MNTYANTSTPYSHPIVALAVAFTIKSEQQPGVEMSLRNAEQAGLPRGITPEEAARYSKELIDSLRKLAIGQKYHRLAQLLEAAESEAEALAAQPERKSA
ncbi:MAG: hypothetical protein WBQ17_07070 [Rhizomicrobium sp.]